MEPQAPRTTGRRWRKVGSVAVCAMSHMEGGLHVGGDSTGKGRVECLICGDDVKTARKYARNAKQCICGGIVHDRCIIEYTGALRECNLPQVLVNRFKKWQKSHNHAARQRRAATMKQKREQVASQDRWQP